MQQTESSRPRRLGRGLSSLLGQPVEVAAPPAAPASIAPEAELPSAPLPRDDGPRIVRIPLDSIAPGRFQPRKNFDDASLAALAESIKSAGVMQPVLLRPTSSRGSGGEASTTTYELIAGERRWRAARLAGLTELPAVVVALSDVDAAQWGLIENLQREDLGTMERAVALAALSRQFTLTHAQIAERVGLDRSTVTNLIRLTDLEPEIQSLIEGNRLSAGHGKALLGAPRGGSRVALAERASLGGWSVRRLEHAAGTLSSAEAVEGVPVMAAPTADQLIESRARTLLVREIERRLQEHLGTKVAVRTDRSGTRGRVILRFYGLDQFEGLLSRMGINPRQ